MIEVAQENVKWHPAFAAAIQLEFKEYKEHLSYKIEHQLTTDPLRIDVVVIKKLDNIEINKTIGKIFRKYNVIEYKSPTDYFSIDDYYKVRAYAYLYKVLAQETDPVDIEDLTISIIVSKYPQKLIKYLKEKQNIIVKEVEKGIYYLKSTDIKTQIIVNNKKLNKKEAEYIKLLQRTQNDNELLKKWIDEYTKNSKDPLYGVIMNVLTKVSPNSILEVYKNMGVPQISNENMDFLLKAMSKLKLDEKLKEEGKKEEKKKGKKAERLKEKQLILKQYSKGLSIEYIAEINDFDVDYVKGIVAKK